MLWPPCRALGHAADPHSAGKGTDLPLAPLTWEMPHARCAQTRRAIPSLYAPFYFFFLCFGAVWEASLNPLAQSDNFHIAKIQDLCNLQNPQENHASPDRSLRPGAGAMHGTCTTPGDWVQPFATQKSSRLKAKFILSFLQLCFHSRAPLPSINERCTNS